MWPINSTRDFKPCVRVKRLEAIHLSLDSFAVLGSRRPNVHAHRGTFGDDVRPRAALDHANVKRHSLARAIEGSDPKNLTRQLSDGIHSSFRIHSRGRGAAVHRDLTFAHPFAGGRHGATRRSRLSAQAR